MMVKSKRMNLVARALVACAIIWTAAGGAQASGSVYEPPDVTMGSGGDGSGVVTANNAVDQFAGHVTGWFWARTCNCSVQMRVESDGGLMSRKYGTETWSPVRLYSRFPSMMSYDDRPDYLAVSYTGGPAYGKPYYVTDITVAHLHDGSMGVGGEPKWSPPYMGVCSDGGSRVGPPESMPFLLSNSAGAYVSGSYSCDGFVPPEKRSTGWVE